jgi:DNA-binding NarL/FixJ family response regulator
MTSRKSAADLKKSIKTLTNRQLEAAYFCSKGFRNKEIAKRMRVSEFCVKYHLRLAYRKLGVFSRVQLMGVNFDING